MAFDRMPPVETTHRRRWVLGGPIQLPTDQGDVVIAQRPSEQSQLGCSSVESPVTGSPRRPATSPPEPSSLESPSRPPSPHSAPHASPRREPRPGARPPLSLHPDVQQLHLAPAAGLRWLPSDRRPLPWQPPRLQARRAREDSVNKLRRRVQRADADLARALEESARCAERERAAPQNAAEEERQVAAAIAISIECNLPKGGSGGGGGGWGGGGGPRRPAAPSRDNGKAVGSSAEHARAAWQPPRKEQGAALRQEEERQLEEAIAASLRDDEQRRADARYEENTRLLGFVDSLRQAGERALRTADCEQGTSRDEVDGRALALRVLEQQLAGPAGDGLGGMGPRTGRGLLVR